MEKMIDFLKFGFTVKEIDGKKWDTEDAVEYENELLAIQHWKTPNVCIISIRRERFVVFKSEEELIEEMQRTQKSPASVYRIKEGITDSQRKMAELLLTGNTYNLPLYFGTIKDETFFEILLASICTDVDKIMQCGS